jgi:translation initiation factor 4E
MAEDRAEEGAPQQGGDGEVDLSRRHPLECRWTLWFDNPAHKQSLNKFGQGLRPVYSFDTVEDFWW